jgi:hypothetical protein
MSIGRRDTQAEERLPCLVEDTVALSRCFLSALEWQNLPFPRLFNARSTTLDENNQDDDEQNAGNDPNQSCIIHLFLSLF